MEKFGLVIQYLCLSVILGIAVWQDITTKKIKNHVSVAGAALGLIFALLLPGRHIVDALLGFVILLGAGMLCWKLHVFRAGDAKLLCAVGSFTGWKMGLNCLMIAILVGAVIGFPMVVYRIYKKKGGKTTFPFSIAIAIGCAIGLIFGYLWEIKW